MVFLLTQILSYLPTKNRLWQQNQKSCVATKSEIGSTEDFISRLPDELLTQILSYLPTKSSVATSILSKRWCCLWISVPNLDFDGCSSNCSVRQAEIDSFIDGFLSLNIVTPVRTIFLDRFFSSVRDSGVNTSRSPPWLDALGERDAEEVELSLPNNDCSPIFSLPASFFNQKNLVSLNLHCVVLKVAHLVCFPKLKEIGFTTVRFFDETSLNNILRGSPVLHTLLLCLDPSHNVRTLHLCSTSLCKLFLELDPDEEFDRRPNVVVDSPNLTHLNLCDGVNSKINIIKAPRLASAHLDIQDQEVLLKVLTQISHVKKLHISLMFMTDSPDTLNANLPMFRNLLHLTVNMQVRDGWRTLLHLLHCTPNLVTFCLVKFCSDVIHDWVETLEVPPCFLSSVESVDFKRVGDGDDDLWLITYILKNARILNKLSIHFDPRFLVNETKFLTTLLTLPRSSTTCQVEYKLDQSLLLLGRVMEEIEELI